MEYFSAQDSRYRIPSYNPYANDKMKGQAPMLPLKTFSFINSFNLCADKEQHPLFSASRIFQPPPFIVGGFVGSKICEQKAVSLNCGDLLGQIIKIATSFEPLKNQPNLFPKLSKKMEPTKTLTQLVASQVAESCHIKTNMTNSPPNQRSLSPKPMPSTIGGLKPVSPGSVDSESRDSGSMDLDSDVLKSDDLSADELCSKDSESENSSAEELCSEGSDCEDLECNEFKASPSPCDTSCNEPRASRTSTSSESSVSSWWSDSPPENIHVQKYINPHVSNIVMCLSDDDSDDDSDWDCVDDDVDFASENGEIISEFKWNNYDSLSPIMSPVTRTPPAPTPALEDYDSDESEGFVVSCGPGYVFDDEEEARERQLAQKRIDEANRRWLNNLEHSIDVPDGIQEKTLVKKVRFPDKGLIKVHSMVAWSYAYRTARKGDWESHARDRVRFRERIETIGSILAPVLQSTHREKVQERNLQV